MHARQRTASGEIGEGGRSGDRLYQEFPRRIICRAGVRHRTVGQAMGHGKDRPWPAEECFRGVSHQYCSKRACSCRSMAEQGISLASRSSVRALAGRISLDDVRETEAGKQPGRSIPSAIQAILMQGASKHFHSGVSRGRVDKCMLLSPLDEGGRSSTTASLNIARAGGDLKKGRTRRPSFDSGFE